MPIHFNFFTVNFSCIRFDGDNLFTFIGFGHIKHPLSRRKEHRARNSALGRETGG